MKKYLALFMAIALLCTSVLLACSCGGNGNGTTTTQPAGSTEAPAGDTTAPGADETTTPTVTKTTYTITVKDANGNPVEGVIVKLCEGEVCRKPVVTGADGSASYSFIPNGEQIKAMIEVEAQQETTFTEKYTYSSEYVYLENSATEVTLTVTEK